MATCKECIKEDVCRYNDGHNLYCKEDYECPHFKTKADVVEVVRCGQCKHCKQNSYTKDYVCTKMPNANVVKLKHYCGYGEKKCDNG